MRAVLERGSNRHWRKITSWALPACGARARYASRSGAGRAASRTGAPSGGDRNTQDVGARAPLWQADRPYGGANTLNKRHRTRLATPPLSEWPRSPGTTHIRLGQGAGHVSEHT
jgi:hypothetical protein